MLLLGLKEEALEAEDPLTEIYTTTLFKDNLKI